MLEEFGWLGGGLVESIHLEVPEGWSPKIY